MTAPNSPEDKNLPSSAAQDPQAAQALIVAQRTQTWKRYGLLAAHIVGQIALGAAGCALMFKIKERGEAKSEQQIAS